MNWLEQLFTEHGIAQAVVVYGLVIAIGIMLGKLKFFGISLGITWILFAGIAASYFGLTVDTEIEHFLRDFGLIFFVYSIGLQVGPGFFASLKKNALTNNILSASVVVLGILITITFYLLSKNNIGIMAGLMSGAVTNTPGLGAAQAALRDTGAQGVDTSMMTLAYAVAYPFGVFGIIFTLLILQKIFRVNVEKENALHRRLNLFRANKLVSVHLSLDNPQLIGQNLKSLFALLKEPIIVSRMLHEGDVITPNPETIFSKGDVLLVVTPRHQIKALKMLIGDESELNLKKAEKSGLVDRLIVVTQPEVTHHRMGDMPAMHQHDFTITRLMRAGVEIMPEGDTYLQLGDTVKVVGTQEGIDRITKALGNSLKKLDSPDLAPIFLGIVLGVILGSLPIKFPNMPVPVKIGLAGGPLIISLLLSRFGGMLYLNNYTTNSANLMLRELGITLFLASVGLSSGHNLAEAFVGGKGFYWMGMGIVITMLPLLIVGFIAHKYFKKTFFEISGLLAGASTDPPALAFALKSTGSDIPSTTYATVYPLTMILRIVGAQLLVLLFS